MAGRRGRGRPATKRDPSTGKERYIIAYNFFQLHRKEGIVADIKANIDEKAKQPLITAPEQLGAERIPLHEYTDDLAMGHIFRSTGPSTEAGEGSSYHLSHRAPLRTPVPLLTFIDGFGLFRNMYRTLMGVYLIIASFSFKEKVRRSDVLPLTLGPHGANFDDVVNSLQGMYDLDGGVLLTINGKETLVCVRIPLLI